MPIFCLFLKNTSSLLYKVKSYPTSSFNIVKNQVEFFNEWNLQSYIIRKEKEVNKIINYLFN